MTSQPSGLARFPNGTMIQYDNFSRGYFPDASNTYLYPTVITDANGNTIMIKYDWNSRGDVRIVRIVDTLGRIITFHYEETTKLLTRHYRSRCKRRTGRRQQPHARAFKYERKPVTITGFSGLTSRLHTNEPWMLRPLLPCPSTGYWFGDRDSYSPYGMIKKVAKQRDDFYVNSFKITRHHRERDDDEEAEYADPSLMKASLILATFQNVTEPGMPWRPDASTGDHVLLHRDNMSRVSGS